MKLLLSKINLFDSSRVSKLFSAEIENIHRLYATLSKNGVFEKSHPSGPCLPGIMRPFVDVDGRLFPCERVSEESAAMQIGHINTGFDIKKVENMLNVGQLTADECKECWCFLHCTLCVAACDGGDELSGKERLKHCNMVENSIMETLFSICLLGENGYDLKTQIAKTKGRFINK